ncbi:MAG: hypothetical protein KDD50_11360, partial [Bdellovibrionales bacterium]|nr:hypothetical protein [Bdellovibrionales bacterium]
MKVRKLLVPKVSRKKRPTINLPLVGVLTLVLFVSAGYLYYPKEAHHFIDNIHIQLGPIADAEEGSPGSKSEGQEKNKTTKGDVQENNSQTKEDANKINAANLKNWTDEELSHFSKLNERKRQLDQREQQLAKLEEELHKQKIEIESRIKRLEELRGQISKVLTDRVNIDQEKVVKLVDFYSNM